MSMDLSTQNLKDILALSWGQKDVGGRTILSREDCSDIIVVDWDSQVICLLPRLAFKDKIDATVDEWKKMGATQFDAERLLQAEGNAISDIIFRSGHVFVNPFQLFAKMEAISKGAGGTYAVYESIGYSLGGTIESHWIIFDNPDYLSAFENALTKLSEAVSTEDKTAEARARNVIFFYTRECLTEHWLKVGELGQGGWVWLEALLDENDQAGDIESGIAYGHVWCGECLFVENPTWWGNNRGEYMETMMRLYEKHNELHKDCSGDLR